MSLTLKGLYWQDRRWYMEIRCLAVQVKGETFAQALEALGKKLEEIAPDLDYRVDAMDNLVYLETENAVRIALLILERKNLPWN